MCMGDLQVWFLVPAEGIASLGTGVTGGGFWEMNLGSSAGIAEPSLQLLSRIFLINYMALLPPTFKGIYHHTQLVLHFWVCIKMSQPKNNAQNPPKSIQRNWLGLLLLPWQPGSTFALSDRQWPTGTFPGKHSELAASNQQNWARYETRAW